MKFGIFYELQLPRPWKDGDELTFQQPREMAACGLRRDAGMAGKFTGRQRHAAHQRRQHVGAGGVAHQVGGFGNRAAGWKVDHGARIGGAARLVRSRRFGEDRTISQASPASVRRHPCPSRPERL